MATLLLHDTDLKTTKITFLDVPRQAVDDLVRLVRDDKEGHFGVYMISPHKVVFKIRAQHSKQLEICY